MWSLLGWLTIFMSADYLGMLPSTQAYLTTLWEVSTGKCAVGEWSVCLYVCMSVFCVSVCLYVSLSVCLSVCLCVCVFVTLIIPAKNG